MCALPDDYDGLVGADAAPTTHGIMLAALKRLDAWWMRDFPQGPDGDLSWCNGLGQLSEDTCAIWRDIRSAIARAEARP